MSGRSNHMSGGSHHMSTTQNMNLLTFWQDLLFRYNVDPEA